MKVYTGGAPKVRKERKSFNWCACIYLSVALLWIVLFVIDLKVGAL